MSRQEVSFMDLPSEMVINILSRLPVRSIISCKCVCKSWLELLSSSEFSKSHLLKSKPGLVVYSCERGLQLFKIFEYEDSSDNLESHELHYNPVAEFDRRAFTSRADTVVEVEGSANGLLFLGEMKTRYHGFYICNPITREYIELANPEGNVFHSTSVVAYGFGVSKMTGQHKVVRIFHDYVLDPKYRLLSIPKSTCLVYTLGTGSWRSIAPGARLEYSRRSIGAFLNGNLHWLVRDRLGCQWISCFDLQTEVFSTFSPPSELQRSGKILLELVDLRDCLCLCDNSSQFEIVIWLMKEYGVEKSWTKEFVISKIPDSHEAFGVFYPIKVFKDGDILMWWEENDLLYYSSKSRALSLNIDMFGLQSDGCINGRVIHSKLCFTQKLYSGGCRVILNLLRRKKET